MEAISLLKKRAALQRARALAALSPAGKALFLEAERLSNAMNETMREIRSTTDVICKLNALLKNQGSSSLVQAVDGVLPALMKHEQQLQKRLSDQCKAWRDAEIELSNQRIEDEVAEVPEHLQERARELLRQRDKEVNACVGGVHARRSGGAAGVVFGVELRLREAWKTGDGQRIQQLERTLQALLPDFHAQIADTARAWRKVSRIRAKYRKKLQQLA